MVSTDFRKVEHFKGESQPTLGRLNIKNEQEIDNKTKAN